MAFLLFFTAFVLSGIAAYYSVIGLIAIFSAAAIPVAVMASSLELAKLVVASWLYRFWKQIPLLMKAYFTTALMILMLITSMGIFGFLSKAHSDQSLVSGDVQSKIAVYDEKIKTSQDNIDVNRKALKQLDEAVDQVMGRSTSETGADKAVAIRKSQAKERARMLAEIAAEQKTITGLREERAPIAAEVRKVEAEVGPIKYIAAFVYGDNPDENMLERSVRWLIILLICVFDPLAVLMLIAANLTQIKQKEWKEQAEGNSPLSPSENLPATVTALEEVPNDTLNETIPNQVELPVVAEPAVEPATHDVDTGNVEAVAEQGTTVEAVGEPVKEKTLLEQHPYLLKGFDHFEGLKPLVYIPEEPKKNPETVLEQNIEDKSISEPAFEPVTAKAENLEEQLATMINNNDVNGLEAIYKQIVKELAKNNRGKSTHWGPLKTKK